nr:MAG TPA: hypothetical protein [Caudoviricetes sp.]
MTRTNAKASPKHHKKTLERPGRPRGFGVSMRYFFVFLLSHSLQKKSIKKAQIKVIKIIVDILSYLY